MHNTQCRLENSWGSMWNPSMLLLLKHLKIQDWIQLAQPFEEAAISSTRKLLRKTSASDRQASWPKIPSWKEGPNGVMDYQWITPNHRALSFQFSLEDIQNCHLWYVQLHSVVPEPDILSRNCCYSRQTYYWEENYLPYSKTSWKMLTMTPADLLSNAVFSSANQIEQSLLYQNKPNHYNRISNAHAVFIPLMRHAVHSIKTNNLCSYAC